MNEGVFQDFKKGHFSKELLQRYLNGLGTEEDKRIISQWLEEPGAGNDLFNESLKFWDELNPDQRVSVCDGEMILGRIYHKIKIEEGHFMEAEKRKPGLFSYLTRIAALLVVPLLFSSMFLYFQNRSFVKSVAVAEIHAPEGTRTNFNLPDGSKGYLNGGSSLKFPTQFTGKTRDVKLTGEAYFDVLSDSRKPFIVSAGNIDIKATGTSFNVMAYSGEPITEVTLKSGRIEVLRDMKVSLGVLKPEESFSFNSVTNSAEIKTVNVSDKLSWLDGKLTFKYEPFEDIIRKLNRWYNVNISIKDQSLQSYIYYGTFQNETLDEVLKLLQYTAPIRYKDYERKKKQDGTFEKRKIEIYSINK